MKNFLLLLFFIVNFVELCKSTSVAKVEDDYILNFNLKSFFDNALIHNDDGSVSLKELSNSEVEDYNEPSENINFLSVPFTITNPFANLYENFKYLIKRF